MASLAESHGCYSTVTQAKWASRATHKKFPSEVMDAVRSAIPLDFTVIDIGATIGWMTAHLKAAGYNIVGIDGSDGIEELSGGLVTHLDLVSDDCSHLFGKFDWGLFLDVGEHIPPELETAAIDNVARIPSIGLIVSWNSWDDSRAFHVNLRDEPYVVNLFESRGWQLNEDRTDVYRSLIGRRRVRRLRPLVFMKET